MSEGEKTIIDFFSDYFHKLRKEVGEEFWDEHITPDFLQSFSENEGEDHYRSLLLGRKPSFECEGSIFKYKSRIGNNKHAAHIMPDPEDDDNNMLCSRYDYAVFAAEPLTLGVQSYIALYLIYKKKPKQHTLQKFRLELGLQHEHSDTSLKPLTEDAYKKIKVFFSKFSCEAYDEAYIDEENFNIVFSIWEKSLDRLCEIKSKDKIGKDAGTIEKILHDINRKEFKDLLKKCYREENVMVNEIVDMLNSAKQIILYGPPGTGKTYLAKQVVAEMLDIEKEDLEKLQFSKNDKCGEKDAWDIVQFHPSYNYEDFVRGIAISTEEGAIKYTTKNRVFAEMCAVASKSENGEKKFCLIIDEINRADLASVLGELIYALEYRGEAVRTPYGIKGDFTLTIPDNLYIIGTMNTADRSIGHIDYAVRRRFAFEQILPDKNMIHEFAQSLFDNTVELFGEEAAKFYDPESESGSKLSSDYHWEDVLPGHSYFMVKDVEKKEDDEIKDELAFKFKYQVWPLLEEYHKDGILEANPADNFNFSDILEQGSVSTDKIKEKYFNDK